MKGMTGKVIVFLKISRVLYTLTKCCRTSVRHPEINLDFGAVLSLSIQRPLLSKLIYVAEKTRPLSSNIFYVRGTNKGNGRCFTIVFETLIARKLFLSILGP
jgi:hypothetical protein